MHIPNYKHIPFLMPASFTIVMGTGALSIATLEMSAKIPSLYLPALFLNYLNLSVSCLLLIWAIVSWPGNIRTVKNHFEQPDSCALYAALGIALLVLGTQLLRFEISEFLAICLWLSGVIVTFVLNYGILLRFFLHPGVELQHVAPVFFVPVASMVVIPVGGLQISTLVPGFLQEFVILASIISLGGGLLLYCGLFSMILQCHLILKPLPDQLAPTLWIHIAPIGWSGVALITFGKYLFPPEYGPAFMVPALLLFGGALWWLVMAAIICIRALIHHSMPFSMVWWSFIFPIGSVTILSGHLEFAHANLLFNWLWGLLAGLWLYCAIRTVGLLLKRLCH